MFTHMLLQKKEIYRTHEADYELLVYQAQETGEFRIYVSRDGFGVGDIFTASHEVVQDTPGLDIVETLLATARSDIDKDEFGRYSLRQE